MLRIALLVLLSLAPECLAAAALEISTDHPRLFLTKRRLHLLQRERDRQSMRWQHFHSLIAGQAAMPEPGFANALSYQVSGDVQAGKRAVDWATGPGTDVRQIAIVFDWCQALLTESQSRTLAGKLRNALSVQTAPASVQEARSRTLAAIALAGHDSKVAGAAFEEIVGNWWQKATGPEIAAGRTAVRHEDQYALFEMMHAVRDNAEIEMREAAPLYFRDLPLVHLLSYYPPSYPAPENEYRLPALAPPRVDLAAATMSRAAALAMMAYEPNAVEYQYVQGWLMHDRYLLRSALGIPYEFLWANPYQPGLSYYNLPLACHDAHAGTLFLRTSWDDDAQWLGYFSGQLQICNGGQPSVVRPGGLKEPVRIGDSLVISGGETTRFESPSGGATAFVLNERPGATYQVEIDDEELQEVRADRGGIVALVLPARVAGVRIRPVPATTGQNK